MHVYMGGKTPHCALIQIVATLHIAVTENITASDLCDFITFTHCGFIVPDYLFS